MLRNKNKKIHSGFTIIELLVVVAIISLLTSIALIGYSNARRKARDAKRLGDMTQMLNALALFEAANKGYPGDADANGIPDGLSPSFSVSIPSAPLPEDVACTGAINGNLNVAGNPINLPANTYYYVPQGNSFPGSNGSTVYDDFRYYFCVGVGTESISSGVHYITATGIK